MNADTSANNARHYLDLAFQAWSQMAKLRSDRDRYMDFTFGKQWSDIITKPDGESLSEADWAMRSGARPITNNLIRKAVKTIVGIYRTEHPKPVHRKLRTLQRLNNLTELDARAFEEFLISGCIIQRVIPERRPGGNGVWIDNVPLHKFFVNNFSDPRGYDIELIGMIHDMSTVELHSRFSMNNDQVNRNPEKNLLEGSEQSPFIDLKHLPFFQSSPGKHRVIELWTLESLKTVKGYDPLTQQFFMAEKDCVRGIKNANATRDQDAKILLNDFHTVRWKCRWITAEGELLDQYLSPFHHGLHPFAVKFYPLTDGKIHPFIEDIVDQQKYINRMITLIDSIMHASAKGVLLFPEDRKPTGYSWEDIAELWSDCRGIIPYKSSTRTEDIPRQITTNGATAEAQKLLTTQIDMMNQISGVSTVLTGNSLSANASATLYDALRQNSRAALADIFGAFESFIEARDNLIPDSFKN